MSSPQGDYVDRLPVAVQVAVEAQAPAGLRTRSTIRTRPGAPESAAAGVVGWEGKPGSGRSTM